jgi:hypothetical protein
MYYLNQKDLVESINALKEFVNDNSLSTKDNSEIYLDYQSGLLFLQLISEIEYFLFGILKIVLKRYPQKIGDINFNLSEILQHNSNEEIIDKAIGKYLNEMMYKKPKEYKEELLKIISCESNYLDKVWPEYVEMKARRDLGVHNNWKANATYLRKLQEVGKITSVNNDDFLKPDFNYFQSSFSIGKELTKLIYYHMITKFS